MLPVTVRNVESPVAGRVAAPGEAAPAGSAAHPGRSRRSSSGSTAAERDPEPRGAPRRTPRLCARRRVSVFDGRDGRDADDPVPKPGGAKAFEVVGIPLEHAGFYVVELASPKLGAALLGEPQPFYVRRAALVTNSACTSSWARVVARLGDARSTDARRSPTRRSRCATAAATRSGRAAPTPRHRARSRRELPAPRRAAGVPRDDGAELFRDARAPATTWRSRCRTGARASRRGASTCRPAASRAARSRTRCSTARWCAPARRVDEALRAPARWAGFALPAAHERSATR